MPEIYGVYIYIVYRQNAGIHVSLYSTHMCKYAS